jgi:predicted adenine nucleotide alpha hydrolase (AANH) superfamily ATPase
MKMLLHICCAPCTLHPYYRLKEEGIDIVGFFYNPNIHPYQEYRKRLETVKDFSVRVGLDVEYRDSYDLDHFLLRTAGKGPYRCEQCYRIRLEAAGAAAKERGITVFTTSLLYSRFQQHDLIAAIGKETASELGIEFYYEDFRNGWKEGIIESKAMGLYRQQYCGCIYSERDRYQDSEVRQQTKTSGSKTKKDIDAKTEF